MSGYRIRLFTLCGFQVWIDASWLLIAGLIAWTLAEAVFPSDFPGLATAAYWWMGVAGTIGVFFSIVFHETAHSLVARHFGVEMRGITLFIFGGVAEMPGEPPSPHTEFLMALAGPISSLFLSVMLWAISCLFDASIGPRPVTAVIDYLAWLNAILGAFNLVPAFPLDGGRMVRAAVWGWKHDIVWATRIAAGGGEACGWFLIALGIFAISRGYLIGGVWQMLIGMFLRSAATSGYQSTMMRHLLGDVSVAQAMTPNPIAVPPDLPISRFIEEYIYRYHHREFPVGSGGTFLGKVGTKEAAMLERDLWPVTEVAAAMEPITVADTIAPECYVLDAIAQMSSSGRGHLFVVRGKQLVGVISRRDLMELVSAKLELASHTVVPNQRSVLPEQPRTGRTIP